MKLNLEVAWLVALIAVGGYQQQNSVQATGSRVGALSEQLDDEVSRWIKKMQYCLEKPSLYTLSLSLYLLNHFF
jgi:hypothetical protein